MSFGKSLFAGLAVALVVAFVMHNAMMSTGNNGEFADSASGNPTSHYYAVIGVWMAIVAIPLTLLLTLIGLLRRKSD